MASRQPVERNTGNVRAVREVYTKVFDALDESNFFTERQNALSKYAVVGTPALPDILRMLDPLHVRKFDTH